MIMHVKSLTIRDIEKIKNLWDYCFEKKNTPFFKWYFNNYCQAKNVIGCFSSDSHLMGMTHLNPYKISLNGVAIDTDYLVGVATAPEYRRRGVLKALMQNAFAKMLKQNKPIAILMPSAPGVYKLYGFSYCYFKYKYTMPILDLAATFKQPAGYEFEFLNKDNYTELQQVYKKFTKKYNGFILRDQKNWYNLIDECFVEGGYLVSVKKDNLYCAYMLYMIKENTFQVVELIFSDEQSKVALLSFASQHFSQCEQFVWQAPIDDLTFLDFPTNKHMPKVEPFMMARIIEPISAFELLAFKLPLDMQLTIQIQDDFIKDNNKVFVIKNGKMQISSQAPDAKMDISILSQLYFGAYEVEQLHKKGLIEVFDDNAIIKLQTVFGKKNNYINEYF